MRKFVRSFGVLLAVIVLLSSKYHLPLYAAGIGTWDSPYSVAQANTYQNGSVKTVSGYVVGQPTSATNVLRSGFTNDYAIALADTIGETSTGKMIYVQISSAYRSSFGLYSNPGLLGSYIKVTGTLTSYFSPHSGVKDITRIEKSTVGATPTPTLKPTATPTKLNTPTPGSGSDTYYQSAQGKSGTALKQALHEIIDDHTKLAYDTLWTALRETDQDPLNQSNVILLYTGRSQGKYTNGSGVNNWNREHVWAKSHGNFGTSAGPGTDLHHIRPTDVSVNSDRGNLDFDIGGIYHPEATQCRYDSDSWEPRDKVKGDVARMLFYMAVRYEGDSGEPNLEVNNSVNNGTAPYHGKLSALLQWHIQDPVDDTERRRNEVIFKWQKNRNPFIDHPEWVTSIWQ